MQAQAQVRAQTWTACPTASSGWLLAHLVTRIVRDNVVISNGSGVLHIPAGPGIGIGIALVSHWYRVAWPSPTTRSQRLRFSSLSAARRSFRDRGAFGSIGSPSPGSC
eukprot:COSAG06_NODE_6218_length_3043_cov_8.938256_5_plen_108_part_00